MKDLTPNAARQGPDPLPIRADTLFYRETDRSYEIAPHVHRIHQWYVLLHGGVDVTLDGKHIELHPEQSIIVPPLATRGYRCRERAPGYLVAVFESFSVDLSAVTGRVLDTPLELRGDLLALVEELRSPTGAESRSLTGALLARLLIGLKRAALAGARPLAGLNAAQHHEVVAQAELFMERYFYRVVSRAEIAEAVHLSEPQLGRVFKAATGKTVLERLTEIRMSKARTLLLETDLPVTQIALDVGITSFSHFSKVFRSTSGHTPKDFRRLKGRQYS
jgi:AraC-like DNA-binding protein